MASGVLAAGLAVGLLGGGTAWGMAGGQDVADGSYRFVAKVDFGDLSSCTGVLVDSRWVATAKDCFAEGTTPVAAGAPTRPTTVFLGRADVTGTAGHRLTAVSVIPNPDRNIALVELSAPVKDIAPVSLDGAPAQVGESLRVAGYGRTATEWVPNRLHTATFTVQSVAAGSFEITGESAGASICKGDAGGPAFREVTGHAELVGLSDRSWQKGCLAVPETRDGATEARTDDVADWIRSSVAVQPAGLREPVTGEFNRDGYQDLIAADTAGALWLYPGTATRNVYGHRVQIGSGWTGYRELVVGHVNRDAYDDLVAIETGAGRLWMYPGTAAGGGFGARVQIGSGWTDFRDLAIGNVNHDQYDDLLTVQDSTQKLFLYAGNATGGNFDPGVQFGSGWGCCKQVSIGLYNNDAYDDLLTVDSATGKLRLYPGSAAGANFGTAVDPGAGAAWNAASYVVPGRFDSTGLEGLLEVDAATGQTWLHPRTTGGGWATRVAPGGKVGTPQPYELTKLVAADFNRDAYPDLIGTDANGVLWLHPGTAAGIFGPRVQIGSGWTGYRELVVGRVNRDAFDDLVTIETATGKLWMYPGTAAGGGFGARQQIGSGWTDFRDLAIGNVNHDQYDDLLTVQSTSQKLFLYAGNATGGNFDPGVQFGSGWGCCAQVTLGKFNNDTYDDLLTVDTATGKLRLYPGSAAGANFGASVDPGAGTGWQNRTDLTPVEFGPDERTSLLSKDSTGALVLNRATTTSAPDWNDPIRFGPRD